MLQRIKETAQVIGGKLLARKASLSTTESCTGGRIAASCCSIPGASSWFISGIVAYTPKSKQEILGVSHDIIREGVVTSSTAEAMAIRMAQLAGSDFALSTTGVCGPGESEGLAPCRAWIGVYAYGEVKSFLYESEDNGRELNILSVTIAALSRLLQALDK